MLRMPSFAALAMVLISGALHPARAGDPDGDTPVVNCDDAMSTYEMNFCADKALTAADAKLNAAYGKTLDFIRKAETEKPYDPASWETALRESQRAWVAFRDADCSGLVPMRWGGGTGTTVAVLDCKLTKTEVRTKELVAIFKGE